MSENDGFQCERCGSADGPPVAEPPFDTDLGRRVARGICRACWDDWKDRQMLLINHYGLNLRDRDARSFLLENMRAFLFGEGEGAEVDTSRQGDVDW